MLMLTVSQPNKLNCVLMLILASYTFPANVATERNDDTPKIMVQNKTLDVVPERKGNLKDETVVEIHHTPTNFKDDHNEKMVNVDEKSLIKTSGKALGQEQETVFKGSKKTGILEGTTKAPSKQLQHHQHIGHEDFVLSNEDDISESLKTGFYFFLLLSSGAIVFIIFKIYRLRLSRAERKYGVQGDRTTQELTPLPTSIDEGHSDDEDQTLFEVQRQNIRIL